MTTQSISTNRRGRPSHEQKIQSSKPMTYTFSHEKAMNLTAVYENVIASAFGLPVETNSTNLLHVVISNAAKEIRNKSTYSVRNGIENEPTLTVSQLLAQWNLITQTSTMLQSPMPAIMESGTAYGFNYWKFTPSSEPAKEALETIRTKLNERFVNTGKTSLMTLELNDEQVEQLWQLLNVNSTQTTKTVIFLEGSNSHVYPIATNSLLKAVEEIATVTATQK